MFVVLFLLQVTMYEYPLSKLLTGLTRRKQFGNSIGKQLQCIPLYTMLLALNRTVIDWFSLDLEGSELTILRTLPFDKITIKVSRCTYSLLLTLLVHRTWLALSWFTNKVLTVEWNHIKEGKKALKEFMFGKGYKFFKKISGDKTEDLIFRHSSQRSWVLRIRIRMSSFVGLCYMWCTCC